MELVKGKFFEVSGINCSIENPSFVTAVISAAQFRFSRPWLPKDMTCCIITRLFISLKKHCENVSEKEQIFADEGATLRALLKNKNAEKYV
jgi:hypothetical protein